MCKDTSGTMVNQTESVLAFRLLQRSHLSQKNLLNQSLRMNPKKKPKRRSHQSPSQKLVQKRRLQSPNLRILSIYCPQIDTGWLEEAVLKTPRPTSVRGWI